VSTTASPSSALGRFVSLRVAAQRAGVGVGEIRRMIRARRLVAYRPGKRRLVVEVDQLDATILASKREQ
jgi:excisionase family DNA binding protein